MSTLETAAAEIVQEFNNDVDVAAVDPEALDEVDADVFDEIEPEVAELVDDIRSVSAGIAQDAGDSVTVEAIESDIAQLVEFDVGLDTAERNVRDDYSAYTGEGGSSDVADIDDEGSWHDVEVEIIQLFEPQNDAVVQVGRMADETGDIKFTRFAGADMPELEEGETYAIDSVVSDEYQGTISVKMNNSTSGKAIDEDIDVSTDTSHAGTVVSIGSPSGLIKRCSEDGCTNVLRNGRCSEHGQVEGEFDLRVKAVLDDGERTPTAVFQQEEVEALTDMTLEEAQEMAKDALDTTVVADELKAELLGQKVHVTGREYPNDGSNTIAVNEFEVSPGVTAEAIDEALVQARSNT